MFTSNAFAIMGLRSLYFMLADMHARFSYLAAGSGDHPRLRRRQDDHQPLVPHPDPGVAVVIVIVLVASVSFSLRRTRRLDRIELVDETPPPDER